ncbi:MAG: FAD-dependent oxidoreductase, partial [Kiloniellales bacterium]|nr:FAD-dependent oxidoreductase [Kiloniellales bacterium]
EKLIIATGATPRSLSVPGADLPGIFFLRDLNDSFALRERLGPTRELLIIGGGFIGLEVAVAARQLGTGVTLLEAAPQVLGRSLPPEVAETLLDLHRGKGVEIRTSASVVSFFGKTVVEGVLLADNSRIEADSVLIAAGITPNVRLALEAGLNCENGIIADDRCHTGSGIFAIGDAAAAYNTRYARHIRLESWQNAEQQAEIAARAIIGETPSWGSVPWVWSDQYGYNLQTAGFPASGDTIVQRRSPGGQKSLFFSMRAGSLVGAAAIGQGTSAAKDLRIAQMMIERGFNPEVEELENQDISLKRLLNAA